jgi:uncharacterized protein (UPF0276 family)
MLPAIGFNVRRENRLILDDPAISGIEITFERADDPLRLERFIGDREYDYVGVHALKLSPASPEPPRRDYLDALRAIALENGAASISDHLGFTRGTSRGVEMGHFAPPPYTEIALDATSRNVDLIQRAFRGLDFYIENIAYPFQFEGTMTEAEFLVRLIRQTGCGWLLDVHNVYANARNHGYDAREFISQVMPATDRVEMHLAGGFLDERTGFYVDSHSEPISEDVWELYRFALQAAGPKVKAAFIERDTNFPDEQGWHNEVRTARRIAEDVFAELMSHEATR